MGRTLILIGVVLILIGLVWHFGEKFGLGKLPGDIVYRGEKFVFHFPIVSCLILSVVLTALFWVLRRFFGG